MNSIDRITAQGASRTYTQNTESAQSANAVQQAGKAHHQHRADQKSDSVTLSQSARSLANARTAVVNAPDVRSEKVAEIKKQISDGTYQVSSSVLARKMMSTSNNPA